MNNNTQIQLRRLFAALLCCVVFAPVRGSAVLGKPNIIFFLTDDQRSSTLGCYGNTLIKTPTLDGLAAAGVRFENAFCETPICAVSRSTLFTGLSERTHGYNFCEPPIDSKYIPTSYPVVLKQAGYRTGFAGKYGVQFAEPGLIKQFDFFRSIGRNPYLHKMPDGSLRHETDLCADAAIEFIQSNPAGQPFCMSVSFNATHAEDGDHRPGYHFQWPESTDGMYEDIVIPSPRLSDKKFNEALPPFLRDEKNLNMLRYHWRWDTPEKYQINMRAYYRMASGIDNAMARVLAVLKEKGLAENTIIIYNADNGYMMGDRGMAGKWNHYEQSLRVPLIVFDPRLPEAQRGRVADQLVSSLDMAPTLVEWAGVEPPDVYQGHSLVPLINNETGTDWPEDLYCEHYFKMFNNWYGVRGKRYKYAVYYEELSGPYECLYDLEKDPDELVNLAKNPEWANVLSTMKTRLAAYLKAYPQRTGPHPAPPAVAKPAPVRPAPVSSPEEGFSFTGNQFEMLSDVPELTQESRVTWRMEVNIALDCEPGAVLMGNRNTPGRKTTFFKITPSKGVQLFVDGKKQVRIEAVLPHSRWVAVEVVKDGPQFSLRVDGKQVGSTGCATRIPAMPCYLGGDPTVQEFAKGSIRNAAVTVE